MANTKDSDQALIDALADCFKQSEQAQFVVGLSGGLDSTVLLHLSWRLLNQELDKSAFIGSTNTDNDSFKHKTLSAIHVHHGLSPFADQWATHVESLCTALSIPCKVLKVNLNYEKRQSLEAQARDARYKAFVDEVDNDALMLLGHHQDDQAETFLLQLARGAGPKGLSAMAKSNTNAYGLKIARPLLNFSREQLHAYAQKHSLNWVEDESNHDERFDRNFLRAQVMPLLKSRWPSINQTISRSAKHCASEQDALNEYMNMLARDAFTDDGCLLLKPLLKLSVNTQILLLRHWLDSHQADMPSTEIVNEILKQACASDDAQSECSWQRQVVRRFNGKLYFLESGHKNTAQRTFNQVTPKSVKASFKRHQKYLRATLKHQRYTYELYITDNQQTLNELKASLDAIIPPSTNGQTPYQVFHFLKPQGIENKRLVSMDFGIMSLSAKLEVKRPTRSLKKYCQQWKIPPWERNQIPIITYKVEAADSIESKHVLAFGERLAVPASDHSNDTDNADDQTEHLIIVYHST
uniref:tRNA lysidine(34) synthetase TilS n=1 Tax=Ningiella ruwaisensis TaxID=2364274 RepID=UPI0010A04F54|nr:tRNA lysidine(34) synthetase TilS [Ningiella ruwaisensis]